MLKCVRTPIAGRKSIIIVSIISIIRRREGPARTIRFITLILHIIICILYCQEDCRGLPEIVYIIDGI